MTEAIKDFLSELITEETVRNAIIEYIRSYDIGINVSYGIKEAAQEIAEEKARELIESEIQKILDEPMTVDDGWGRKTEYGSFAEMVKWAIRQTMKDNYKISSTVQKLVYKRIEEVCEAVRKEKAIELESAVVLRIADELKKGTKEQQ